jgi:hypothetical protein
VDFNDGNFAIGNAFGGADVDLISIETTSNSPLWTDIEKNNFEDAKLDVLIIRSYASGWSGGDYNSGHIRRIGVRTWDIPVLGESYFGKDSWFGQNTKVFALSIKNYFDDKPYRDGGYGDIVLKDDKLNPLSDETVEDKDDDGYLGKKEDINKNGTLDGDKIDMNVITWKDENYLNPFDIDKNGLVELPQQKGDSVPQSIESEYDRVRVFRHVITHELGHAVGMGNGDPNKEDNLGHCFDQECVMYKNSINWHRDGYFCPYHQQLIQIDNSVKSY